MTSLANREIERDIAAVGRIGAVRTILEVVCRTTGMRFAAVARVTEDRWVACEVLDEIAFGLARGGELKIETTICNEIRDSGEAVVIDEVAADALYAAHHTPAMYGFQSYISMPIRRRGGEFFGTLCAIDPAPHKLDTPETIGMFKLFADLIGFHLDSQDRLDKSQTALLDERQAAEFREQFIAVLGHDLRNPLASLQGGLRMMRKTPLNEKAGEIAGMMQNSIQRMAELIDNVLDFARGRLGGGFAITRSLNDDLGPALEQVIAEARLAWPNRDIRSEIALCEPIECDNARLAQMLSNLVGNALTHGAADRHVTLRVTAEQGQFELSVANGGKPIPSAIAEQLFRPFFRAPDRLKDGLGLGLYIVSEIARAHGGTLDVASTDSETRFTFRMATAASRR